VARASWIGRNHSRQSAWQRGAFDFSHFCFGACLSWCWDAGDRGVWLGLFVALPFCLGMFSVLLYSYHSPRDWWTCLNVALAAVGILGVCR